MLQVTDAAVSVLKTAVLHEGEQSQQPETPTAVRIRPAVMDDGGPTLTLQPVTGPEPGDEPTEATDLDVFVAPELAGQLGSAVLDVEPTPEGPEMVLRPQSESQS